MGFLQGRIPCCSSPEKAAQLLHEMGVDVSFSFEEEPSEEEIEQIKENHILALFHNPEKAGRFALLAGKAGKKGFALSGSKAYGISLAEGNILSFFQNKNITPPSPMQRTGHFPSFRTALLLKKEPPSLFPFTGALCSMQQEKKIPSWQLWTGGDGRRDWDRDRLVAGGW